MPLSRFAPSVGFVILRQTFVLCGQKALGEQAVAQGDIAIHAKVSRILELSSPRPHAFGEQIGVCGLANHLIRLDIPLEAAVWRSTVAAMRPD
jgi:hypothetical protein